MLTIPLASPPAVRSLAGQPHVTWRHQVTATAAPVEMSAGAYYSLTLNTKWHLKKIGRGTL